MMLLAPHFPTIKTMKSRARRLRATTPMAHSAALETLAHQCRAKDWNTYVAQAARARTVDGLCAGDRVAGRYLGHEFEAEILELVTSYMGDTHRIALHLDAAIDVVTSQHFNNFRRRIQMEINDDGCSAARISNGTLQLEIEL